MTKKVTPPKLKSSEKKLPALKTAQTKKVPDIKAAAAAKAPTVEPIVVVPPPAKPVSKEPLLRADVETSLHNLLATLRVLHKETAGAYDIAAIADEEQGYGSRLRVLKTLRGGDRVAVKDAEPARLKRELYDLLGTKTAGAFAIKCAELLSESDKMNKLAAKEAATKKKADIARREADIKRTAWQREVHDGKPILDAPKKLTKKQEAADAVQFKASLAAKAKRAEEQLATEPIAVPKPDAKVNLNLEEVCVLEDPSNGIVMLRLEKPNSQGAICVYNNGSRVAAGVVPTEVLVTLRSLVSTDLVRDVNQLLHPMTAGVVVTSVAERHLTALLQQCKESIDMGITVATEKVKKFAPPAKGVAKKAVEKSATESKTATPKATAKVVKAEKKAPKKTDDRKIKLVEKKNPKRESSASYVRYELYKTAKTVAEFIAAGGTSADLNYDAGKGYIALS